MSLSTRKNLATTAKNLYRNVRLGGRLGFKGGRVGAGLFSGITTGIVAVATNPITWVVAIIACVVITGATILFDLSLLTNPIVALQTSVANIIGLVILFLAFVADTVLNLILFGIVFLANVGIWIIFNVLGFFAALIFFAIRLLLFFAYLVVDFVALLISGAFVFFSVAINTVVDAVVTAILNLLRVPFTLIAEVVNGLIGTPTNYIPLVHDLGVNLMSAFANTFPNVYSQVLSDNSWDYLQVNDIIVSGIPTLPVDWNFTLGVTELYQELDSQVPNVLFQFQNVQLIEWIRIEIFEGVKQILRESGLFPSLLERLGLI